MSALSRHPNPQVEQRLTALRKAGWKVILSRHGTFYDITCKTGTMNTRISARLGKNSKGRTAWQELVDFLIKHEGKHSGE